MLRFLSLWCIAILTLYDIAFCKNIKDENDIKRNGLHYFMDADGNSIETSNAPALKSKINEWELLTGSLENKDVCYAISRPFAKIGNHKDARDAYLMIIYFSSKRQEINIATGYTIKESSVNISIDGIQYSANSFGEIAIPYQDVSQNIIRNMFSAKRAMIKAESSIGTYSVDAYSISDFRNVYTKLAELCDFM